MKHEKKGYLHMLFECPPDHKPWQKSIASVQRPTPRPFHIYFAEELSLPAVLPKLSDWLAASALTLTAQRTVSLRNMAFGISFMHVKSHLSEASLQWQLTDSVI